jgi:hypothetical protein
MGDPVVYERAVLYEQVWKEPVTTVARSYGVSGRALAKVCRSLGVPVPGRGYWARVAAGQRPKKQPLPPRKPGARTVVHGTRHALSNEQVQALAEAGPRLSALSLNKEPGRATAPAVGPHPLVQQATAWLTRGKPDATGIVACLNRRCVAIQVSRAQLERALLVMDAVLKAFEAAGYRVEVTTPTRTEVTRRSWAPRVVEMPVTQVEIDGERVPIILDEHVDTIVSARALHCSAQRELAFSAPRRAAPPARRVLCSVRAPRSRRVGSGG